jgi:hypothetical protein
VLPFASFVYFSHDDNFYLNDAMTSVDVAADVVRDAAAQPVVLYPGDVWDFTAPSPSATAGAIARYHADAARVRREGPRHRSEPVPIERVLEHGRDFVGRIRARNGVWARLLPRARVFLEDVGQTVTIGAEGPRLAAGSRSPDIVCRSDVLDYAFLHDWGLRTADINGRFQVPRGGRYWRVKSWGTLAGFNGRAEGLSEIGRTILGRIRSRLP